jgi:SOS response regulatory protein OraA/RecX
MADDVADYIKSNLKRGLNPETIKQNLLSQGCADYDIDKAFSEVNEEKKEEGMGEESLQ